MILLRKVRHSSSVLVYSQVFTSIIYDSSTVSEGNECLGITGCQSKPLRRFCTPVDVQIRPYSSTISYPILVQTLDPASLSLEIVNSLDERRLHDAWFLFEKHQHMDGLPEKSVIAKLIATSSESLHQKWLVNTERLVQKLVDDDKTNLLTKECLIYLSLCLAKGELPVEAANVLRLLVKMEMYPPVAAWSAVLAHMCRSAAGASLAAQLVGEIGFLFHDGRVDPRKKANAPLIAMKPNATAIVIALAGCLNFCLMRKAEDLLQMLPRISVKQSEELLIVMAHVYGRNGRREELKKLERYIDEAPGLRDTQFRQFHNCLLHCYIKVGDLDSASEMVLKMLRLAKKAKNSLAAVNFLLNPDKPLAATKIATHTKLSADTDFVSFEEFSRDRKFILLDDEVRKVLDSMLKCLEDEDEPLIKPRGIHQPTEKLYVKLTKAYLEAGKTKELGIFLIKAEQEDSPSSNDNSIIIQVINSCISTGRLDQAHDLLDEVRLAGGRVPSSVYASLLKSYCGSNKFSEAQSLLRDARRANVQLNSSCYELLIKCKVAEKDDRGALLLFQEMKQARLSKRGHPEFDLLAHGCKGEDGIMSKLLDEMKEGEATTSGVHHWNNVIHFFSKKRLMQDAEQAFERMKSLGHSPNAETYHSMVTGYAAVGGNYLQVTEIWGELKSHASSNTIKLDQELLDAILYAFVRGGFFVRANEVVEVMEKKKMFIDRYKYRTLFLKYHRTLCKGKASKSATEAQIKRRDAVLKFKRWAGLV